MASFTAYTEVKRVPHHFQSPIQWRAVDLDWSGNTNLAAMLETGTHGIFDLAAGQALAPGGFGIVKTAVAGTSSTVQFKIGAVALTPAIPEATLAINTTFMLNPGSGYAQTQVSLTDSTTGTPATTLVAQADASETGDRSKVDDNFASIAAQLAKIKTDVAAAISSASVLATHVTSADTIDVVVGTAALTAGRIILYLPIVDVTAFTSNG